MSGYRLRRNPLHPGLVVLLLTMVAAAFRLGIGSPPLQAQQTNRPNGSVTNAVNHLTAPVVARLDKGDLNGAIQELEALCLQHPTNTHLLMMRARMGMFRAQLARPAQSNEPQRTRLRKHCTQLPKIDQPIWAAIRLRTKNLASGGGDKIPYATVENLLTNDVRQFMLEQKDFLEGWLLQARLALLLDRAPEGTVAGFNLDQLGAWETGDPGALRTLEQLDERGWILSGPSKQK